MIDKIQTVIYIVRHGESTVNLPDAYSQGDRGLTDKGRQQVEKVADHLDDIDFDFLFASDLPRAIQTAEIIGRRLKRIPIIDPLLRERRFSQEYYTKDRLRLLAAIKQAINNLNADQKMRYVYSSDMESALESAKRMEKFVRKIARNYAGKTICAVSHSNILRSFLVYINWCDYDEIPSGSVRNTGYIRLLTDGRNHRVTAVYGVQKKSGVKRIL